jgi:hypothetical protein
VLRKLDVTVLEARALVALLRRRALLVRPTVTIRRSRDPADDKFLECAVAGEAAALVTADADLLTLGAGASGAGWPRLTARRPMGVPRHQPPGRPARPMRRPELPTLGGRIALSAGAAGRRR